MSGYMIHILKSPIVPNIAKSMLQQYCCHDIWCWWKIVIPHIFLYYLWTDLIEISQRFCHKTYKTCLWPKLWPFLKKSMQRFKKCALEFNFFIGIYFWGVFDSLHHKQIKWSACCLLSFQLIWCMPIGSINVNTIRYLI